MVNLVFNSDDFGLSLESNLAIMEGHTNGVITSTCILANGEFYNQGIKEVLPEIPKIGRGVHLNIIEGKSLTNPSIFTNSDGFFNKGYLYFLYNSNNKKLISQIETEFRAQIEKILSDIEIDHINSHVHTHSIPNIFNMVLKLALEYKIKFIRTQYEKPYIVLKKVFSTKYPVNLIKLGLLNTFSTVNKKTVDSLNSKSSAKKIITNDYLVGVNYTGYMDESSILSGLLPLKNINDGKIVELIIHPKSLGDRNSKTNYKEFVASINPKVKNEILKMNFNLTNYKELNI